jgi:hypothetical protein
MRNAALLLALVLPVAAEKVDMPREGLEKTATHIVVGEVRAIYTRQETAGDWRYTRYLAEVAAKEVEKGEGLAPGLVYVRYWHREWHGGRTPPLDTAGHRGLPKEGETLRIYLARNAYDGFTKENADGGFNVIGANGFERLP